MRLISRATYTNFVSAGTNPRAATSSRSRPTIVMTVFKARSKNGRWCLGVAAIDQNPDCFPCMFQPVSLSNVGTTKSRFQR
jgi:hypothetical protein